MALRLRRVRFSRLSRSYDFFKAELLKTPYFEDNILCHTTASFAAVRSPRQIRDSDYD